VILNRRSLVIGAGALIATGPARTQDDAGPILTGRVDMTG
jgi:hypothetical protein